MVVFTGHHQRRPLLLIKRVQVGSSLRVCANTHKQTHTYNIPTPLMKTRASPTGFRAMTTFWFQVMTVTSQHVAHAALKHVVHSFIAPD